MSITKASTRGIFAAAFFIASRTIAQSPDLSSEAQSAIQELSAQYARALSACSAEKFADLFVPESGVFASGFRGRFVGRDKLIALVRSERHCSPAADAAQSARPGGTNGPTVVLEVTADGVHGIADLGSAEYQDDYVETPQGWRFASRTVIIAAEKAAGLDAGDLRAIHRLGGSELGDFYEVDSSGVSRLLSSGVRISVVDGEIHGRVFLQAGGYRDEVYEKLGPGRWRALSSIDVPSEDP